LLLFGENSSFSNAYVPAVENEFLISFYMAIAPITQKLLFTARRDGTYAPEYNILLY
jgi:hypothetical protein